MIYRFWEFNINLNHHVGKFNLVCITWKFCSACFGELQFVDVFCNPVDIVVCYELYIYILCKSEATSQ